MFITVLNHSPKGEDSITLQVINYLKKAYSEDHFEVFNCALGDVSDELLQSIRESELVIHTSSIFHLGVHAQMIGFLDQLSQYPVMVNKPVSYVTTSLKLGDSKCEEYIARTMGYQGARVLQMLSLFDEEILSLEGQSKVCKWFEYLKASVVERCETPKYQITWVYCDVDDRNKEIEETLREEVDKYFKSSKVITLEEYQVSPCVACYNCYTNRQCVLSDDFLKCCDDIYNESDFIVFVGTLHFGELSEQFKKWLDRHVQWGRVPDNRRKVFGYVVVPDAYSEARDTVLFENRMKALNEFGGNYTLGVFEPHQVGKLIAAIKDFIRVVDCEAPINVTDRGNYLHQSFVKLAYSLQNLAPQDYEYYNSKGEYSNVLTINDKVAPISNEMSGMKLRKGRLIPYTRRFESVTGPTKI